MTTHSQTTTVSRLREARGASQLLKARWGDLVSDSADHVAAVDAWSFAAVLDTAAAYFEATPGGDQSQMAYTLTWSTSGDNDATSKAQLLNWLQDSTRRHGCAVGTNSSVLPSLGPDLAALFSQF